MMKTKRTPLLLCALLVTIAPLGVMADTFFTDNFSNGSTLNSTTPDLPTTNSTSYQMITGKSWAGESLSANDLRVGMVATSSGVLELQTLFSTNPIALVLDGDYIQMTVTFTNTAGLLGASSMTLDFGLFNSGGLNGSVMPYTNFAAGQLDKSKNSAVDGGAQNWLGYFGEYAGNGGSLRIYNRDAQTGTDNRNQGTVTHGTGSSPSSPGPSQIGSSVSSTLSLTAGGVYTEVLTITVNGQNSLAITNILYSGPDTSGPVEGSSGGVATNSTFLTSAFDSLSIGYRVNAASTLDISSIKVDGSVSTITTPPDITQQPVNVMVPNGASCAFNVEAQGFNVSYQWYRYGTNLVDGGNISGATTSQLIISPASAADVASGANGYYVVVSGAGGYSTNSATNSLSFTTAKNLVWSGSGAVWDLNNSANWQDTGSNPSTFNYGDVVTFNGGSPTGITLTGNYLSASSVTVDGSTGYAFQGTGSFAGPGRLIFSGTFLDILNENTYTGGTIISNSAAYLYLENYKGLGSGPVTLAKAGGLMEVVPTGGSALGIEGDVNVQDDFTIKFDGTGAYAGVFLGNLSGSNGMTLTLDQPDTSTTNRYRVYGGNTVYDGNLVLNGNSTDQAVYNGTVLAPYGSGTQIYNGIISGNGGLVQRGGTTILAGANTYSGGTVPTTATIGFGRDTVGNVTSGPIGTGALLIAPESPNTTGSGTVLAYGGARTIANPLQYPSGANNQTLIIGGTNQLTFSGPIALQGQDGSSTYNNRIFQVDNTAPTIFSGVVSDGGSGFGFTKKGTGALYLNNANTYTGPTTNTAGLLAGSGSVAGSVVVSNNASIGGGSAAAMGTFTIGGDLTIESGGGGFFRVNRSGLASDKVSVTGTLSGSGTGTIVITNLGAALQVGDTFTLFNQALANGAAMTVTGGGAAVNWTNKLAENGTVAVLSITSTMSPYLTNSVSGGSIYFSWPADHLGWTLQAQTNALDKGLGTNWVNLPGTASVTSTNFTVGAGNASVFYRLIYNP